MRIIECTSLPVTRMDGEKVYGLFAAGSQELLMMSPGAYRVFKKYKKQPDTMTEDDYKFLNYVLTQAEKRAEAGGVFKG